MIGRSIAQYRIVRALGQGGMAVVYEATDTLLCRPVALKLISPHLTGNPVARERFLQEARAASALDHPNICNVHEVGETPEGEIFLVMGLYRGRTIAERLREGTLPPSEALGVARQVLHGLEAAHEAHLVHRDIKPANLLITERGVVKILDFGLVKLRDEEDEDATRSQLTLPGNVVGTVSYMSPEQARGSAVDHRSDLWSTAVVLYAMLTGRLPFSGKDSISTLYAICTDHPARALDIQPDLPPGLDAVLDRALAKEPSERYPSAEAFRRDLESIGSSPEAPRPLVPLAPSRSRDSGVAEGAVLVLPFANLSPDPDTDYVSDGLTDEVITDLSSLASLRVISRTSAMRLKGTTKDIRTLGRELGVRYVLEGSVRRAGGDLRVAVKLIDALTDHPLWAQRHRGTMDEVLDIQERISRSVVDALRVKLTGDEDARLAERPISDPRAYEFWLRARHEVLKFTGDALDRALVYLGQAGSLLGDNAAVLAATGSVHWQYLNAGISSDAVHLEATRACAERALALDPGSPQANFLLALVAIRSGDIQASVRGLRKGLEHHPNDVDTLFWLIAFYAFAGHPAAGRPLLDRLLSIDTLTPFHHALRGMLALSGGDLAGAPGPFGKAVRMEPGNPVLRHFHGHLLAMAGRLPEAFEAWDRLAEDLPDTFFARLGRAETLAPRGDREGTRRALAGEIEEVSRGDLQYSWNVAECYALIGETAPAMQWLENAVRQGLINHPLLARWDPLLDGVRGEPAFARLMDELEPRWESFAI